MVVSVDFFVATESPIGDIVVPLESDLLEWLSTPLTVDVRSVLVETEEFDGIGMTGAVVDCVVVELEDEVCAKATPVIRETAIVAASKVLIMLGSP